MHVYVCACVKNRIHKLCACMRACRGVEDVTAKDGLLVIALINLVLQVVIVIVSTTKIVLVTTRCEKSVGVGCVYVNLVG